MNNETARLSTIARKAAQSKDWETVNTCANQIFKLNDKDPEGYFLRGLVESASNHPLKAIENFEKAMELDSNRYDAAIELAAQYVIATRHQEAVNLLSVYHDHLDNSPRYLDLAATTYTNMSMSEKAWPLYQRANELQPGIELFQANLAACGVFLGKIEEAKTIYQSLLKRNPNHQRNHYHLARLEKVKDTTHIEQMKQVLETVQLPEDRNIFMYYALGKELEDLQSWDEAFHYYKKGGDAVTSMANYQVSNDEQLIHTIIDLCNADWLHSTENSKASHDTAKTPLFMVGLPRTGTTLTERILSSHSQVESVGETQFIESVLRSESGVESIEKMNLSMIESVAKKDMKCLRDGYLNSVSYMLGDKPLFIDKLPYNFLYLGFIAKAFPDARIVCLKRNPMDSCFAMYKQVFTWAYKFSYNLKDLGRYYMAHDQLLRHWRATLGDRFVEVDYESLVDDQEGQTRSLLNKLGLQFEESCLNFDQNTSASMTASSVQIREKVHTRSVNLWQNFSQHLQPLKAQLESAGIKIE